MIVHSTRLDASTIPRHDFNGFSGLLSNLDDFDGTATTLPEPRLLWRVEDSQTLCVLRCSWARGTSELGLLDTSGWLYTGSAESASCIQLTANGRGVGSFASRERD